MGEIVTASASLLFMLLQFGYLDTTEVTFKGSEYIAYDLKSRPLASYRNHFQLKFRTINPTGMLLYSQGSLGDVIQLEIVEGTLRFKSYHGGKHRSLMNLGSGLSDGKWHSVSVLKRDRQTVIKVDGLSTTYLTAGDVRQLNLDEYAYIGGLGHNTKRYFPNTGIETFRGCLSNVKIDDTNILEGAQERALNLIVRGDVLFKCVLEDYKPVTFISPLSYVKFVVPMVNQRALEITFKFRTYHKEGLLFSRRAVKVKLYLILQKGSLCLDVNAPNFTISVRLGRNLDNGYWHEVAANISGSTVSLKLNNEFAQANIRNESRWIMRKFCTMSKMKVYAGRDFQRKYPGFMGCMLNLQIAKYKIRAEQFTQAKYTQGVLSERCHIRNRCFPNKCQNKGRCLQDFASFRCDCSRIEYEGPRCESLIYKRTCVYYRKMGLVNDSYCLLRSVGKGSNPPFTVLCNTTAKDRTLTVIKHTKKQEAVVKHHSARITPFLYSHTFQYQASLKQIEGLIEDSENCRQYVRFDCHRSTRIHTQWVARDGMNRSYWGAATKAGSGVQCTWSFTDKDLLPVRKLLFHIPGTDSLFTLSALECWGQKHKSVAVPQPRALFKACVPIESRPIPPGATGTTAMRTRTSVLYPFPTSSSKVTTTPKIYFPTETKDPRTVTESKLPAKKTTELESDKYAIDNEKDDIVLSATAIVLIACASFIFICITIVCVYARRWDDLPIDVSDDSYDTPAPHLQKIMLDAPHKRNGQARTNGHVRTGQASNGPVPGRFTSETAGNRPEQVPNGHFMTGVRFASDATGVIRESEENGNNIPEVESYWV